MSQAMSYSGKKYFEEIYIETHTQSSAPKQ